MACNAKAAEQNILTKTPLGPKARPTTRCSSVMRPKISQASYVVCVQAGRRNLQHSRAGSVGFPTHSKCCLAGRF